MKERILLLNPPAATTYLRDFYCCFSSKAGYYWPAQDLLTLSGMLRDAYEVEAVDAIGGDLSAEACAGKIAQSSARTLIFTTGAATLEEDMSFIARVKARTQMRCIASGGIFRGMGRQTLEEHPHIDALITDFTDRSIVEYCLHQTFPASGMVVRTKDGVCECAQSPAREFSAGVALQRLFVRHGGWLPFFQHAPFAIMVGSFGCTFNCSFCAAGTYGYKKRNLQEMIEELQSLRDLGISRVFFVDPLFTAHKSRVLEFCAGMQARCPGVRWVANAHAATIGDAHLLAAMKAAGCKALMIGVESGNDHILSRYRKGVTCAQIKDAFARCRQAGIGTLAYFIIGLPGEDRASLKRTIDLSKELRCDYASFGYATADRGTPLREESLRKGWVMTDGGGKERCDSSRSPALLTGELSERAARKAMRAAYRGFYLRPAFIASSICRVRSWGDLGLLFRGGFRLLKRSI